MDASNLESMLRYGFSQSAVTPNLIKSTFCLSICLLAYSLQAFLKALLLSLNFALPNFFSTCNSMGSPWQSQPGIKGTS